jgi:glycosyltransferase involved in cell wall biosynthesis
MKKHILFILHFPPPVHGSSVIGLQVKESKLINSEFDTRYINLGTSKTIDEIQKFAFSKIFRYLSILCQVVYNLIFHRPDLCYLAITAEGNPFYKDALIVFLIKLFSIKLVYHLHNKGISNSQNKVIDNLLYRFVFKNTRVILLSQYLYPDIQKYVSINNVYYCPNGIKQIENIHLQDKSNDCVEILFLSNMIESKGVFVLLDACRILKMKNLNFHCTFIGGKGDISESQFEERIVENGLHNYVIYVGKKLGIEKNEFLAQADIFAFPTYYEKETFGLVNLEAMQYELPVISTNEGGIPDVVKDGVTGFIVKQKDAKGLAEKLELLIFDKSLRKTMGMNGRLRYEQNFTLHHFENKFAAILNQVISTT